MNQDLQLKKRIKLISKAFRDVQLDRDGVNVSIGCVNKKCKTHGNSSKKKLCLRVDTEIYHCWVCGMRGKGLAKFFYKFKQSYFDQAKEIFSSQVKEVQEEKVSVALPENFQLLGDYSLLRDPDLKAAFNYLKSRGITEGDMWRYRIGACPSGRYRRRVIIPSFDSCGEINFFTARSIDKDSIRKYINPRVQRSEIIFNEMQIDWNSELTIVEGPFDLLKANHNSTALLGSSLSIRDALFQKIVRNKTPVVLALDSDAKNKMNSIAELLVSYDIPVYYISLEGFSDVGEMQKRDFTAALSNKKRWKKSDKLFNLISSIKSGSLV